MDKLIIVHTSGGYWAKGESLEDALANVRKAGATGTQRVLVTCYLGSEKDLKKVEIGRYGAVSYPQSIQCTRIGVVRVPTKQPKDNNK